MSETAADQGTILTQPPSITELKEREPGRNGGRLVEEAEDIAHAAHRLADGAVVTQALGNLRAITARPDTDVVRSVNILKGGPLEQVGNVVTTPVRIANVFGWSRLPTELTCHDILRRSGTRSVGPACPPHLPFPLTPGPPVPPDAPTPRRERRSDHGQKIFTGLD